MKAFSKPKNHNEVTTKNECNKTRPKNNPYEVWKSFDGSWTWNVLRKYQSPENEEKNKYARWFCYVTSPLCDGEFGDVYVKDIKENATKIQENV